MDNLKKGILIIIGIAILFSVWYFTIKPLFAKKTPEYYTFKKLYNDNAQLALNTDNYSIFKKTGEINKDNLNISFSFSGTDTILEIDTKKETTMKLDINSKITNGKFKIILVSPHNEVSSICNRSYKKIKEIKLEEGKSRIKLVGLGAEGTLNLKINDFNKQDINLIKPVTAGLEVKNK